MGTMRSSTAGASSRPYTTKQAVGLALAVASVAVAYFLPGTEALTHEALVACGILLGAVFMWFCGTMPTGVVGLLGCLLLFVLGVRPQFSDAFSGYTTTTAWFVLAVYCMTALMQRSSLGVRVTKRFILWAGANSKKLVFAIMFATALMSSIMTDTGAVALSMSFVLPLLDLIGAKRGLSNLGKCLLIGVSLGALIGGFTTPCGHSLNVLSLGLLEQTTGETVSYLSWMAYGVPVALVILPAAWFALVKAFPPESITKDAVDDLMESQFKTGKFTAHDYKCLVLMIALPVLWIAGNWIPLFNATSVALLGMVALRARHEHRGLEGFREPGKLESLFVLRRRALHRRSDSVDGRGGVYRQCVFELGDLGTSRSALAAGHRRVLVSDPHAMSHFASVVHYLPASVDRLRSDDGHREHRPYVFDRVLDRRQLSGAPVPGDEYDV